MTCPGRCRFNLVIEVLLISSQTDKDVTAALQTEFQSRNRGSFDFKAKEGQKIVGGRRCFNLVIEVLLISSKDNGDPIGVHSSFHLVIEVLLISSDTQIEPVSTLPLFVSIS